MRALLLCCLTTVLFAACGGQRDTARYLPAQNSSGSSPAYSELLPLPAQLAADEAAAVLRHASLSEADVFRTAAQYRSDLPHNRASVSGAELELLPQYSAGEALSGLAYAIYSFDCSDYDREPLLDLTWTTAPSGGLLYIGLADFSSNRWDWFLPSSNPLNFGSLPSYLSPGGQLFAAVVLLGSDPAQLVSLRLGEIHPYAALSLSATEATAPLSISLDASASFTPEGSITLYEWDFDGDGSIDASGTEAVVEHAYEDAGTYVPAVIVTNSAGHSDSAESTLQLRAQWQHTLGVDGLDSFHCAAVSPEGDIFAAGAILNTVNARHLLISRWTSEGDLVWARTYTSALGNSLARDIAVDGNGDLVLAGYIEKPTPNQNYEMLMQKWSPDGTLLWSRMYAGAANDFLDCVSADGADYYFAGSSGSFSSDADALVLRLETAGALVWGRRYDWFEEGAPSAELLYTPAGAAAFYVLVTENKQSAPAASFPLYFSYKLDGEFEGDGALSPSGEFFQSAGIALRYDESSLNREIYICTWLGNPAQMHLFALNEDRSSIFQKVWGNSEYDVYPRGMCFAGSQLLICGEMRDNSDYPAVWSASPADGAISNSLIAEGTVFGEMNMALPMYDAALYCGASNSAAVSWNSIEGSVTDESRTWNFGAGQSHFETPALSSPDGVAADLSGYVLDDGAGDNDCFLAYRRMP